MGVTRYEVTTYRGFADLFTIMHVCVSGLLSCFEENLCELFHVELKIFNGFILYCSFQFWVLKTHTPKTVYVSAICETLTKERRCKYRWRLMEFSAASIGV